MIKSASFCMGVLLIISCGSSTNITNTWTANDIASARINKVLVTAMTKDQQLNSTMEQQLTTDLGREGFVAAGAYVRYGPNSFKRYSEKQAARMLRDSGFDGVITITLLDKEKE